MFKTQTWNVAYIFNILIKSFIYKQSKVILFYGPRINDKNSKREDSELMRIYDGLKTGFPTADECCLLAGKLVKRTDFIHKVCTLFLVNLIHR